MSEEKGQSEPTMEEILASIRRIISDDNEPEKTPDAAASPPVADEEPPMRLDPIPIEPAHEDDDVLELTEIAPEDEPFSLQAKPEPPAFFKPPEPPREDRLVSDTTAAASKAAFASVSGMFTPPRRNGELPVGNGALTLEEMVRDLVRPMLKDWLDENLPGIVERLVQEEIRRLARDAG